MPRSPLTRLEDSTVLSSLRGRGHNHSCHSASSRLLQAMKPPRKLVVRHSTFTPTHTTPMNRREFIAAAAVATYRAVLLGMSKQGR